MKHLPLLLWIVCGLLVSPVAPVLAADRIPRVLVALYDGSRDDTARLSPAHRFLEMPANHLGYDIQYIDASRDLPTLNAQTAGIIMWFEPGFELNDPGKVINWLTRAHQAGKKLLMIENSGFGSKVRSTSALMDNYNRLLNQIGVQDYNVWHDITYKATISYADPLMMPFERTLPSPLPAFMDTLVNGDDAVSHLKVATGENSGQVRDLVITSPTGGYIAQGYALQRAATATATNDVQQWVINPFEFLNSVLGNADAPKPDVTTIVGSRVFVAMVDGDGWNQPTEIARYARASLVAADVVREEIFRALPNIAFSVGVIAGDLDTRCYGAPAGQVAAQQIFTLPNVEPAAHSYTHPLYWNYFARYTPEKEVPFLSGYPKHITSGTTLQDRLLEPDREAWTRYANKPTTAKEEIEENERIRKIFGTPRMYGCAPFELDQEIRGAADFIERTIQQKGVVRLMQWSGDTQPFEKALIKTRLSDLYNIGGGSAPFGGAWQSITGLSPVGLKIGQERQIYSGYGGEATFTNFWNNGFYGTNHFISESQFSNLPRRLTPLIYYFHVSTGQKQAALAAVREALDFAINQQAISLSASNYAAIARGFYNVSITKLDATHWRISNRGALQTLRFDKMSSRSVNMAESNGVIGQKYLHGNLFVFLDPAVSSPVISMINNNKVLSRPLSDRPYVLESRWQIRNLLYGKNSLRFAAYGYGSCDMRWKMPDKGQYIVTASRQGTTLYETRLSTDAEGLLNVALPGFVQANLPLDLTIRSPEL